MCKGVSTGRDRNREISSVVSVVGVGAMLKKLFEEKADANEPVSVVSTGVACVAWGGDGRWRENEVGAKEGEESY